MFDVISFVLQNDDDEEYVDTLKTRIEQIIEINWIYCQSQ